MKNQISYLENCLEDTKRKEAKICVSWPESVQRITNSSSISIPYNCSDCCHIENHVEALPNNIEEQVIKLMQDELAKLNKEFELL